MLTLILMLILSQFSCYFLNSQATVADVCFSMFLMLYDMYTLDRICLHFYLSCAAHTHDI